MSLLDRIKLISEQKKISISYIEKTLGFANKSIYRWGTVSPSADKVLSVAKLLNVSLYWLLTGEYEEIIDHSLNTFIEKYINLSPEDKRKINNFIEISLLNNKKEHSHSDKQEKNENLLKEDSEYKVEKRIYNYKFYKPSSEPSKTETTPYIGTVAAGIPNLSYYKEDYEYIHSPVKCDFAMRANGDSMYPVIKDNDYIFVKSTPFIEIGDIGIISIEGETTCKKFFFEDNKMILKSFNPEVKPMEYEINEFLNIKILGKVILTPDQEKNL